MNHPATPATAGATTGLPLPQQLITSKLPAWMASAAPSTVAQLRSASTASAPWFERACLAEPQVARQLMADHALHRQHEAQLRKYLKTLPELEQFASERLSTALKQRLGLHLDVTKTYLFNAKKAVEYKLSLNNDPLVDGQRAVKLATQSLLHCALQNFEAAEAQPGGMDDDALKSVILDSNEFEFLTPLGKPVNLSPEFFAGLCRELDIGGSYQELINALYQAVPTWADGVSLMQTTRRSDQYAFRQQLHLAFLEQTFDRDLYHALLTLCDEGQADYQEQPLQCNFMQLFDITLTDALIIGAVPARGQLMGYQIETPPHQGVLLTYLPGAPTPLKLHASVYEAQTYLRETLLRFEAPRLLRLVPAEHQSQFLQKMQNCLRPDTWNPEKGYHEPMPDLEAWVPVTLQHFSAPFLDELATHKQQRIKDDACFHAVSTAQEDRLTTEKRLAYFSQLSAQVLGVAAFFVPGLGQLMLGLSAAQLSYETFEGLESWAENDKQQALAYLLDVVENVAMAAALGAAGSAGDKPAIAHIAVETPSFIEALETVELDNGDIRLWQPDLRPFAHDIILPADLKPDEFGLYHHDGKTWLALEDHTYAVTHDTASNQYRLEHPTKAVSYQPPLRHNGAGAWLHPLDTPQQWQGMALFRRLGHLSGLFEEATAGRILDVSATQESVLRKVLSDSQQLPALLQDTLSRFMLDEQVMQTHGDEETFVRVKALEDQYSQLPASQAPEAAVIQRVYPGLPAAITEELLSNATVAELGSLASGKVPLRLGEEIRLYQQQVRLTRAYEGLYLDSVRNWDSDRLVLHSLQQLPGWPGDLRIDLHQGMFPAGVIDSTGPADSAIHKVISSDHVGYIASDANQPGNPQFGHATIFEALFEVLTPEQRAALGTDGVTDAAGLRDLLRQAPLLPRWQLRKILKMQRAGFRSPMRLADGRVGYPLTGSGNLAQDPSHSRLLALINSVQLPQRLTVSPERILQALRNAGMEPAHITARLDQLTAERVELQQSFDTWRAGPGVIADLASREASRNEIEEAIWQSWYHSALPELNELERPLRLHRTFIAEFPAQLPDFIGARVRHLQLNEVELNFNLAQTQSWDQLQPQLSALFNHLPNLEQLEIERPYQATAGASEMANSLPLIISSFPRLRQLRFLNQNLELFPLDFDRLATLDDLQHLDLSGNRLGSFARFSLPDVQLDFLGLNRMELDHWPTWLGRDAFERLGEVSLRDNRITAVPEFLLANEPSPEHHSLIQLNNNAIRPEQLESLHLSQDGLPRRFRFELDLPLSIREHLSALVEQRQQLRDAVEQWATASSSSAPLSDTDSAIRSQIGTQLLEFWRRQTQGMRMYPLRLEDEQLLHFPARLPDFFYPLVRNLRLTRINASTAQLDQFLGRFPHLIELNLGSQSYPLQALPPAIGQLRALRHLTLRDQGLVVDQQLLELFAGMSSLDTLELSGNHVGAITHGPSDLAQHLLRLDLSNTGLLSWPTWVEDLMPLHLLNLDDNQLTELPEHILSNPRNDESYTSISLSDNPLSHDSMSRAHLSQGINRSYTFDMDLPEDVLLMSSSDGLSPGSSIGTGSSSGAHTHSPLPLSSGDVPDIERWLEQNDPQAPQRRALWQTLSTDDDANNLLPLIGRLQQAAPMRHSPATFIERVWDVLEAVHSDPDLRSLLNVIAQDALIQHETGMQTCHDGALLVFNQIEEQLFVERTRLLPLEERRQQLYQRVRGLYRRQALDDIARELAGTRDEAEVRLAYRLRLGTALSLPLSADNMLYEAAAGVSSEELGNAATRVREGERGEAFLEFAAGNELWLKYLREAYAERFEAIERAYKDAVNALADQFEDDTLDELSVQYQALEEKKAQQIRNLIHELTNLEGHQQM